MPNVQSTQVNNSSAPALLTAYGAHGISMLPAFSVARLLFMHSMGGVFAVANIRGGGCVYAFGQNPLFTMFLILWDTQGVTRLR